jgi:hypothetical protein
MIIIINIFNTKLPELSWGVIKSDNIFVLRPVCKSKKIASIIAKSEKSWYVLVQQFLMLHHNSMYNQTSSVFFALTVGIRQAAEDGLHDGDGPVPVDGGRHHHRGHGRVLQVASKSRRLQGPGAWKCIMPLMYLYIDM